MAKLNWCDTSQPTKENQKLNSKNTLKNAKKGRFVWIFWRICFDFLWKLVRIRARQLKAGLGG